MKELTIEEKAEAYDKAIERARKLYNSEETSAEVEIACENIFPELIDNKMEWIEKIRQELKTYLEHREVKQISESDAKHQWIAWLEKQDNNINCIYDKELSELLHIVICRYVNDPDISYIERRNVSKKIFPYVELLEKRGEQNLVPDWMPKFLDELRSKKNYFDWNEHKDIEGGILAIINWLNPNYFNGKDDEQKPYGQRKECEDCQFNYASECKGYCALKRNEQWLKSLKPQPKQEWSEEDEEIYRKCICTMRASACGFPEEEKFVEQVDNWLKSLKPQKQWKPTEEQITWLYRAADDASKDSRMKQILNELLSDLKKLREK